MKDKSVEACMSLRMRAFWSIFHNIVLWWINSNSLKYATGFQNETDRLALLAFKQGVILDPHEVFNSWNSSLHYCDWQGVSCSRKHRERVTVLDLSSQGLVGTVSPHIGNLSFLRILILLKNGFYGEIPSELGQLHRLKLLHLNNNSFQGEFPTNLTSCTHLTQLNLIDNNLKGNLPALSSLPYLLVLGLGQNNFKGKIPPALGNLSSLILLSLTEAGLEGSIPEDLGRLTRLQYLLMGDNNLNGTIPSSIYNLSDLITFAAHKNKLEGNLPANIGSTLPNLHQLAFGGNRLSGAIPVSLSNASHLELISFTANRFSGPIPGELGRLVNLSLLRLGCNILGTREGHDLNFIPSLTNCSRLEILLIGDNFLDGPLPHSIANLSNHIRCLSLGANLIYGTIPLGIGDLVELNFLEMRYLMLNGNIPYTFGNLQKLLQLYIQGNRLSGQIPTLLGNLTNLFDLHLGQNELSGNIPPSLGNCQKLQVLDLSHNNINGDIPPSIYSLSSAIYINLSHNSLVGSLLAADLKQLELLDVSENKLSGAISDTFGSCLSLVSLRIKGNFFKGAIPQALHALRGLEELDLSRNILSGMIPGYLGEFPFLQKLNLSFNELEGAVPETGIFRNVSAISIVGNKKLCGGISELKLPTCKVKNSNKRESSLVLKISISILLVAVCLTLLLGFFILGYKRNKSAENLASDSFDPQLIKISYGELLRATDAFSEDNLIGIGGYGTVYKGILRQNESIIAVKVFNLQQAGASKSFISECRALGSIRHRNLQRILSVCSSVDYQGNDFRAVIYEFMQKGSLENWLHLKQVADSKHEIGSLTLACRLNIAIDVASALEYLHCHSQTPIVHCDLKPSNVLLDEYMVAHLGDFGLAKVLSKNSSGSVNEQSSTVIIKGTTGYVAPEYCMGEQVSIQGDMYSYGILLLELFTAKRPTDDMFKEDLNLHNFTRKALPDQVMDIVDPHMPLEKDTKMQECLISVLKVGLSCSMINARDRMQITDVVRELHLVKTAYEVKSISKFRH